MTVGEILQGVRLRTALPGDLEEKQITGLDYDSRRVKAGFLFFAFPGAHADGRQFAKAALEEGAVAVVSDLASPQPFQGPWIEVEHGRQALALAARNFYGKPDERLGLTGVTGTNGKTTTAFLIDAVLRAAGKTTALVGTIEYRLADEVRPAVNTTPESLDLYRIFNDLERMGGTGQSLRHYVSHRGIHEPYTRSPGFPPDDGELLSRQAAIVRTGRRSAPALGGDQ
jgi:UDP-N-acetylmuramoyl-L-alanyl-D-glutamate--2,6-diaminopimelate ligase